MTVELLANDTSIGKELTLDESNNWSGTFEDLLVYDNGKKMDYRIVESSVHGVDADKYTVVVSGNATDGFTITNTNKETVNIAGSKTWDDDNNRDGMRPKKIIVRLLADNTEKTHMEVSPEGQWKWEFKNLPKYDPVTGKEITYSISEDAVDGYATEISGANITNTHEIEKTSISVEKKWVGDPAHKVTIRLCANGEVTNQKLELSQDNAWKGEFSDLPKYEDGELIVYTVVEDELDDYATAITGDAEHGFTVINTKKPDEPKPDTPDNPQPDIPEKPKPNTPEIPKAPEPKKPSQPKAEKSTKKIVKRVVKKLPQTGDEAGATAALFAAGLLAIVASELHRKREQM